MEAASSAAQAEHDNAYGGAAYCSLRYLDLAFYALYFFGSSLFHVGKLNSSFPVLR
jgi:hypothetical protein